MSQAGDPLPPPGPAGPPRAAPADHGSPIALPGERCSGDRTAVGEQAVTEPSTNQSVQADTPVWGNCIGDDLIRKLLLEWTPSVLPPCEDDTMTTAQPQRLPQPNASPLGKGKEETGTLQNGHAGLSNGSGIHSGVKLVATESRRFAGPVSQKMHRKIQSSLSVSSESSKKSAAYSQKPGSSPEDCCVHCILACLFCEFVTLCSLVLGQTSCGVCPVEACCCCCGEEMGDDCNCPCDTDCGIMDACCESSDCLEICMECCGICFPS